jgi:glycosyltransferase involved in cell wall biosynthesis
MTTANVLLALAAWRLPALRTIGVEQTYPPQLSLGYMWKNLRCYAYGLLNVVTALTKESEGWIKDHTNARRVSVIPNAISWPLSVQEPRVNPSVFCSHERKILLTVGRLGEEKGFDRLIDVFYDLSHKYPCWDLVILGEGRLRTSLERQAKKLSLEKRIFFPGRVGNVGDWYKQADLYVMSSRFEGFPNTLIEAMAHGLAAVSFDCDTGPRNIIRHEIDGLLVPPEDAAAMTVALNRLMSDADLRQRFANKAAEAQERFSMEKIADMWENLFEEILCKQRRIKNG